MQINTIIHICQKIQGRNFGLIKNEIINQKIKSIITNAGFGYIIVYGYFKADNGQLLKEQYLLILGNSIKGKDQEKLLTLLEENKGKYYSNFIFKAKNQADIKLYNENGITPIRSLEFKQNA